MTKRVHHQLVLFDLDGTLIYNAAARVGVGERIVVAIKEIYGIEPHYSVKKYDGMIEKQIVHNLLIEQGITEKEFFKKFPAYLRATQKYLEEKARDEQLCLPIPQAVQLAELLSKQSGTILGVLTGNAEPLARWKLEHAQVPPLFSFGLFGDEANSRIELAKLVFAKALKLFRIRLLSAQIFVIGDTIHDVACGKAIGARTIGVCGRNEEAQSLAKLKSARPDLVVSSLMDEAVLALLGLG